VWTVVEERYRNADAKLGEVTSDEVVEFIKGSGLTHRVRVICFYFCWMADEDELMAHIEKLKPLTARSQ